MPLVLDISDISIWKEKLINYPRVAGYPRVLGLYEWVGSGRVQQPDSAGQVGHGFTIYRHGSGQVRVLPDP